MSRFRCLVIVAVFVGLIPGNSPQSAHAKKVVFVAGTRSHGYGSHEHNAGCQLLAKSLQLAMPDWEVAVNLNGWPKEKSFFNDADTIVMYADGGGRHPVIPHLADVDALAKQGVGIVCIHYGVEIPKGEAGDKFVDWIGGYFETNWSVNPHWTAEFKKLPDHPISRGVKPFSINDEWYYHMRFRKDMQGVTPILTAIPPASTLSRPDGPHSGNPAVRKTVGQPQHVGWASVRPGGGRGFGFTGGHYHWNWGDPNFRKVVLNAIVWTAHGEVPLAGISDKTVTFEQLEENQDYEPPEDFDRDDLRRRLKLSSSGKAPRTRHQPVAPVFRSKVVTSKTPGHVVEIKADIRGAEELYLVVDDGGNGYGCDWADWAEPRLIGPDGEKKLTELKWTSAVTGFGEVRINANVQNQPLRIDGKEVSYGIGTHANSTIAYKIPKGYTEFRARGGIDNGGTDQAACGNASSVAFSVYTKNPGRIGGGAGVAVDRSPGGALDGLDVAEGLEATLFAAEPDVLSLTNLDIDHRGRVWVCEVINYRRHNGKREKGDRILILEDTDGDGVTDKTKVFYQGRDIDSAMGICVLGNKVIVSASPHVWVFTDNDGDDKPDEKNLLFSNTGQPQHDHSAHSFLFGPDGKLYWNFGNTGKAVHDAEGKPIKDIYGRPVVDNGKPFYGGMAFRCNIDGSEFEVLGHNFRNNYEVTVDSYGNVWQSDNDDDGNRGVRINFVVEHGNYGYLDQRTGAGWRTERTGMHQDIPLRHWHLRDPGVMPNLLQTGAGSPTGITVYEGRLLPKRFWDQVIHCDAGPNIVRAYPVEQTGAGYAAREEMVLEGTRDKWFRPADVCVGPDGSLFVTDWYDPGVGGHNMQDLDRGRLFRLAPPNTPYKFAAADFSTVSGAIEALGSPNAATRYLAWQALHKMDTKAEEALVATVQDAENPRIKARALWLLTKSSTGAKHIRLALANKDPNLRIVALRAARQTDYSVDDAASQLTQDSSPAVRREVAVALRQASPEKRATIWADLAAQYSGGDRWYLEALGLAADGNWDACLKAFSKSNSKLTPEAWQDILWRSRSSRTGAELAKFIEASENPQEVARYFRALDFQDKKAREQASTELLKAELHDKVRDFARVESLKRIPVGKLQGDAELRKRVADSLNALPKDSQFVSLVDRFSLDELYPALFELVVEHPNETAGADAARTLLRKNQRDQLIALAKSEDPETAAATMTALGNTGDPAALAVLRPIMNDKQADSPSRRVAAKCVAKIPAGAEQLLKAQAEGKLEQILEKAVAFDLNRSSVPKIRDRAAKLFPLPQTKNAALPPIAQLLSRRGNAANGAKLFSTTAECAKCHIVRKEGKDIGPSLDEIGSKLSREALYESILFPSAGISHNYEGYIVETEAGLIVTGILISKTDEKIVLKTIDGIQREIPVDDIAEMAKLPTSLMPADIQKTMTVENLVDVIEYLQTLKKK